MPLDQVPYRQAELPQAMIPSAVRLLQEWFGTSCVRLLQFRAEDGASFDAAVATWPAASPWPPGRC